MIPLYSTIPIPKKRENTIIILYSEQWVFLSQI